jgi:hypothetical protein
MAQVSPKLSVTCYHLFMGLACSCEVGHGRPEGFVPTKPFAQSRDPNKALMGFRDGHPDFPYTPPVTDRSTGAAVQQHGMSGIRRWC